MSILNFKKIIPVIAISICGYLIAVATVTENYFLLMLILLPVFTLGVIALVLENNHSLSPSIKDFERPSYRRNQTMYRFLLMLIIGVFCLNFIAPANPSFFERFFASIILILGFIPTYLYIKHNESGVPFLPIFGLIFSLYYGLPIFLVNDYSIGLNIIPHDSVKKALLLSVTGLLTLYLAYYKLPGKTVAKNVPKISIYWSVQKAKFWSILFIIFGLGIHYLIMVFNVPIRFQQPVLFLSKLSIIGTGILFILQLQGKLNKATKGVLWCAVIPSLFVLRLGTGATAQVLLMILFLSMTYWTFQKKLPWKTAIGSILILIVLLSVRTEFRGLTWGEGEYTEKSPIEKSVLFANMAFSDIESSYIGYKLATNRIAQILFFAHVVDQTPEIVPYWKGETYLTLLWTPIPRMIYADKPTKVLGQAFGHRYDLLQPYDYTTSLNFPQLIEMYANFGDIGVIIGMFFMGIIYRALYEMLCHPKAGEGGLLIGLFIFMELSNIESDFSIVFGNVLHYILLLVIISRLMRSKSLATSL